MSDENNQGGMPENTNPTPPAANPAPAPAAQGKIWTDEYVQALRDEAKNNRLQKRAYESHLRTLMGLKEGEDIDDSKVAQYKASIDKASADVLTKANERLILAELRGMTEYNTKLAEKLVDRSKINVAEDGTVTGVAEALTALALEFPEIKKANPSTPPANPANAGNGASELEQIQTAYDDAVKNGRTAEAIALKNKLFEAQKQ